MPAVACRPCTRRAQETTVPSRLLRASAAAHRVLRNTASAPLDLASSAVGAAAHTASAAASGSFCMYIVHFKKNVPLGTCSGRPVVVKACDLQCRRLPQGLQRNCTGIFRRDLRQCRAPTRGPCFRTALAADLSHSREPARALGSECRLDADAFTYSGFLTTARGFVGLPRM